MVLASDYPFLDILGTMLIFFAWVIWFWILIRVFADVFRRHDISGMGKAGWILLTVLLPFLGVLIYLIAHGQDMGKRDIEQVRAQQAQFDQYVKSVAASDGGAAQIAQAKSLLDSGAITQAEYDALKAKALS
ncbi:MAG TPA: SHOCT domain-containing protein [Solirubrobacterales bacterium]|nr:SHOCT domain-containing protein [Solirubrobacterales bacterium]